MFRLFKADSRKRIASKVPRLRRFKISTERAGGSTRRKNLSRTSFSTTTLTRIDLGSNISLRREKPATNRLSHGPNDVSYLQHTQRCSSYRTVNTVPLFLTPADYSCTTTQWLFIVRGKQTHRVVTVSRSSAKT